MSDFHAGYNRGEVYWRNMYYELLRKYDRLMALYEQEVGPIDDIVAFEKRELSDEANEADS